jgi:biopolymer transport protein ExbB/TolQ
MMLWVYGAGLLAIGVWFVGLLAMYAVLGAFSEWEANVMRKHYDEIEAVEILRQSLNSQRNRND